MVSTILARSVIITAISALIAIPTQAQETGHGDTFGDLYHIKRSPETGQPILQKRLIEAPEDQQVWGYCPIPIDINGQELPFVDLSCEVAPEALSRLVEVDYFGRLSGGRTKERNLRMHFDEVIASIQNAEVVDLDAAGRLRFGTGCTGDVCTTWKVVDSPLENMTLYHRVLKYGHIQTSPTEEDTSFHGDPELGTVYHPALRAEDWSKFRGVLVNLLPRSSASECFTGDTFDAACADPQMLTTEDFVRIASFLGGAADKTGKITIDLVQYLNRILRITQTTPESAAALSTLPALIRDVDMVTIYPATADLPAPANELFVNFGVAAYLRPQRFSTPIPALVPAGTGLWAENPSVSLLPFLEVANGAPVSLTTVDAFLANSSDALRAIEFIHQYEIPVDLYTVYTRPTTTTVAPVTMTYSAASHTVTLSATVTSSIPVNAGTVTFTVQTSEAVQVGSSVTSGTVINGAASAEFVVPGGTAAQTLTILASYSGATSLKPSSGSGTLTISPSTPTEAVLAAEHARADFLGDAGSDILVQKLSTGVITALALNGHTVVGEQDIDPALVDLDWRLRGTGDFNGDLSPDLLWQHLTTGNVYVWFMDGTSRTGHAAFSRDVVDPGWQVAGVGDFNADSYPDLVLHHQAQGRVVFWLCTDMTVTSVVEVPIVIADKNWVVAGASDFDQDGETDLLLHNHLSGETGVWLMNGTSREQYLALTPGTVMDLGWEVAAIIDANLDGKPDIVWQHTDGSLAIWYMDGLTRTAAYSFATMLPPDARVSAPK